MIPISELKKGNYFHPPGTNFFLRVESISLSGVISFANTDFPKTRFAFSNIYPVILTEKIILNTPFVFVRKDSMSRWKTYQYEELVIHLSNPGFHVSNQKKFTVYTALHELQNICISVLKKELPLDFTRIN